MNELTVRSGFNAKLVCHKFVRVNQFSEFWDFWIVEKGFGNCCLSGALSLSSVVVVQSVSSIQIFVTWWTVACQASLSCICSNSCPLSQWCHTTISSSITPFSSCPQSFPAPGSFPISWLFASGGQSIGASAPVLQHQTIQGLFLLGLTGLISLQSKGLSRVFSSTTFQKHQFFGVPLSLWSNSSHPYMTAGKITALTRWTFVGKVTSLLFNTLSRFVIAFLPGNKNLLISWLQSMSALILEPINRKCNLTLFPLYPHLFAMKW